MNNTLYVHAAQLGLFSSSDGGESWKLISPNFSVGELMVGYDGTLYTSASNSHLSLMRFSDQDKKPTFIQGMPDLKKINSFDDGWIRLNKPLEPESDTKTENSNEEIPPAPNKNGPIKAEIRVEIKTHAEIASFAVSGTAYYVEYQYQLFRWKPGTPEWYDTGLMDKQARDKLRIPEDLPDTTSFKLAVSGETVYVGKRNGHLMQSLNEGNTWNDVTANLPFPVERFNAIAFAGKNVYVATDKGVVRSSNGTDWHVLTDGEGRLVYADRFAVDSTTVYCQVKQKIYQLSSETEIWQQVTPEIPFPVNCFDVDGNTLYVGTSGSGVLRYTIDDSAKQ